jgi:hypothetical protein
MKEALRSSETSDLTRVTRRIMPESTILHKETYQTKCTTGICDTKACFEYKHNGSPRIVYIHQVYSADEFQCYVLGSRSTHGIRRNA